jgi:hypothetical protein
MRAYRCPGCGAAAQKTIQGGHLRWLESDPHETGSFVVLDMAADGKTPQSRLAGMLDEGERFHLHACDPETAAAYQEAARKTSPTRRSGRLARAAHAARSVQR